MVSMQKMCGTNFVQDGDQDGRRKSESEIYLCFVFRYNGNQSVLSYKVKNAEIKHVGINKNNCILSKMEAKMAAKI